MKKFLISAATLLLVTACATKGDTDSNSVTATDLQHHNYVLASIDGKIYRTKKNAMTPNIAFGENMNISGEMCNNYFGQGQLKNDVLTAKGIGMTRKFCSDATLNQLDQKISQLLENGAKVSLENDGKSLILSNDKTILKFWLKDYM